MKLMILCGLFISTMAFGQECIVKSKYTELESGVNKSTICRDTLVAVAGMVELRFGSRLVIKANGRRAMYSVELSKIKYIEQGKLVYEGAGTLHWYPGDSYVILRD